jgi:hypothetical protein
VTRGAQNYSENTPVRRILLATTALVLFCMPLGMARGDDPAVVVQLDVSEVPELQAWGETARDLLVRWHPRIVNLLPSEGFVAPRRIELTLRKSDQGVGGTSGQRIVVSSHWIEKHPEDLGLVIHELVHVVQGYPKPHPGWITEGIADYVRWAIYEGKPLAWFPAGRKPDGYLAGYRVAAGFFLWLESDAAPGIVKKLNTRMRKQTYDDALFEEATGKTLDVLWGEYVKARGET